jgi:hypothetical protein
MAADETRSARDQYGVFAIGGLCVGWKRHDEPWCLTRFCLLRETLWGKSRCRKLAE